MAAQPTMEDKLSFGLWTVGWQTPDLFGTLNRGETYEHLVSDKDAFEDFDIEHRGPRDTASPRFSAWQSNTSWASADRPYRRAKGRQTDAI
jgi:hypothetical protein